MYDVDIEDNLEIFCYNFKIVGVNFFIKLYMCEMFI